MQVGRLRYDIFFKKVFHKKHILKAFLNTVLAPELSTPIKDVTYEPTDFIIKGKNQLVQSTKHDVIDVFCITEQNQRILVELQKGYSKRAMARFMDYQCRNYSSQFPTGSDYSVVLPCYSICWFFDLQPPHSEIKETLTLHSNCKETDWQFDWEIIALYPRNIPPAHIEQETISDLEEWLLLDVVDNIDKATKIQALLQTEEVKEAFEDMDLLGLSEEEIRRTLDLYEEKRQAEREAANREIAKSLLDVLDVETICQKTGLSREEIKALRSS
ncbi:MAG: hypothetical protein DRQ49_01715 [Gammaproteobacteria bacterium]|nr:MAG: hypothetical protein DRQ41_13925 [Gammaproteobacteria bacterium]RKZ42485.1 MAG: hypothetical protein DRQ49_01715 [Gammaproteobacteria bacterium]RKZ75039.1 MAG: hypothetical protein DRQ57_08945 [Gammaproteobacteria bacterium]